MKRHLWVIEWKSERYGWIPYHNECSYSRRTARAYLAQLKGSSWPHRIRKYQAVEGR